MTRDSQNFKWMKKRKIMAGVCFLVIIFFITVLRGGILFPKEEALKVSEPGAEKTEAEKMGAENQDEKEEADSPPVQIVIDVAGAVSQPGIVFLPEGSRVYQAFEAVGGVLSDSDLRDINLAAELLDGERVYVPEKQESEGKEPTEAKIRSGPRKVNINTADSDALQGLSGVGPSTAERILEYRKENGRFKDISELKNVKGIGEKTFEKLKDFISVT